MKCSNCGNEIREGAAFCSRCGAEQKSKSIRQSGQHASKTVVSGGKALSKRHVAIIVSVIAVILCLAITIPVACYFNSESYLYKTASEAYEKGNYVKAEKLFSRITDYEDSEQMLEEAWYFHVGECIEASKYEEALELLKQYETALAEKKGEVSTGKRVEELAQLKGQIAEGFGNQEKYDEAIELYNELGNTWKISETYAKMGNYLQALETIEGYQCNQDQKKVREAWQRAQSILYVNEEKHEEAWEYMKDYAGEYDDEWGQAVYQTASTLADNQRYEDAILLIDKIKEHMTEAEALLAECYENRGIVYAQEGDYEEAWKYFGLCDVTETVKPYLYDVGQFYMDKGVYQEAVTIWSSLKDYQDSETQLKECYKLQGAEYEQEGQYSAALEMYEKCEDADLIVECRYRWAAYAYEQRDYDLAVELFTELGDYANSAEMVPKCRYDQAWRAYSQGDYDLAIQIYTELGDYEDSADKIMQVYETKEKEAIENEKKARRGALDGTWRTKDGNLQVSATGSSGSASGRLEFLLPYESSSVTTSVGTLYGYKIYCGIDDSLLGGANQRDSQYYGGGSALNRTYYWDNWDYEDGTLYLKAPKGGWWTFDCTVDNNTMTLKMDGKTFTLTKQ